MLFRSTLPGRMNRLRRLECPQIALHCGSMAHSGTKKRSGTKGFERRRSSARTPYVPKKRRPTSSLELWHAATPPALMISGPCPGLRATSNSIVNAGLISVDMMAKRSLDRLSWSDLASCRREVIILIGADRTIRFPTEIPWFMIIGSTNMVTSCWALMTERGYSADVLRWAVWRETD